MQLVNHTRVFLTLRVRNRGRCAFTLVEMLVVMAIVIALSSIALLVVPGVIDKDRTTDGAGLVRQWLMIAKRGRLGISSRAASG